MKYLNAALILPKDLVEELQKYIQGSYLYIPAQKDQHKKWGELSGFRTELKQRNLKIRQEFSSGTSMEDLAESYFLSIHAIKKILYRK
ncbi:CD3324 family protein [Clostridium sp. Marseille-P2415]|uniref:CD3324 family protein n=1 Tax=Clostridium sp. Marseille-P2415 TaxID=1805471 RepID=UPI0009887056|nr:CD3324 family protein [Clostridium sp. Marseille-P2415]